ncbi:MAG TPA: DNA-binding domain-containing protein [Pyrinomonadaceae bacterium]|nr:DNA-binding domain-containing protein [Pyrinomonadaceae bacterium]
MSTGVKSKRRPELDRLQQWMQAVITHPRGIRSDLTSREALCSLDADINLLEEIILPSAKLSGAERLAIYCRSYHARLLQCFQSMFPALLGALGEKLFNRFALDYLQHHPPSSYTLDRLADAFPQYLAETRPDADKPQDERECWPDFIIELASLEWAFLKVYDGPGIEGRALPRAGDILSSAAERILQARPSPVSCLRLFAFRYPVHTYMLAARRDENPELPAPLKSFIAMTRLNYRVSLYELSATQYALLESLDGRHTIGQILNRGLAADSGRQPSATTVRDWLCDWADKGFFESLEIAEGSSYTS